MKVFYEFLAVAAVVAIGSFVGILAADIVKEAALINGLWPTQYYYE